MTDEMLKELGWTKIKYELIKNNYFKNIPDNDLMVFAEICRHTKLDPFLKQIYPVMRAGKLCVQTSIDGYRTIAERTGRYAPGRETTYVHENNSIVCATAYVKKQTADGTWHEVSATAYFSEYTAGGSFWAKMPHVMIAKCAEALALRKAFPAELSALYSEEEMQQADAKNSHEKINSQEIQLERCDVEIIQSEPKSKKITEEQVKEIEKLLDQTSETYKKGFFNLMQQHYGSTNICDIPENYFKSHVVTINGVINDWKRKIQAELQGN